MNALLKVAMQPSHFLKLAKPLLSPRADMEWIAANLNSLPPAKLKVWMPSSNQGIPAVIGHDGRHRMTVLASNDNTPVPVEIEICGIQDEDITDEELLLAMNTQIRNQQGEILKVNATSLA